MSTTATFHTPTHVAREWLTDPIIERRGERVAHTIAVALVTLFLAAGAYAFAAAAGLVPAMPWSSLGSSSSSTTEEDAPPPAVDLDEFDIPPGYEPAVPVEPEVPTRTT